MAVYTTIDNPEDYFITHNYSGNDTTNNQTSLGMTPDLVWVKSRNTGSPTQHYIVDKVRGDEEYIISNSTAAEATDSNTFALVSGGFNLDGGNGWTNLTGRTYVAWNWKESATAGFDIVSYTGNGTDDTDISHNLSAVPHLIIVKNRDATDDWQVYHHKNTAAPETDYLVLNTTAATADAADRWSDEAPTSSVFTLGDGDEVNTDTEDYIAYCFTGKQGYSKFGSYTGNGNADGSFVYTGFRPAFVMTKYTSPGGGVGDWNMYDNKRKGYNDENDYLAANTTSAENSSDNQVDLLSNGFKWRATDSDTNEDGSTYVYMAFAEAPLVNSNGVPCNAR